MPGILVIASVLAQVPFFAPGILPGFLPSFTPQIIPSLSPTIVGGLPAFTPNLAPNNLPSLIPNAAPSFIPGSYTTLGVIRGICGACSPISTSAAAVLGVNGQLLCLSQCGTARQARFIPVFICAGATSQDLCDDCFYRVRCDNVLGLTQTQLDTYFVDCFCLSANTVGCPSCNQSKKGLLGLLGLLGLIPLILLLCLLLLCCLRRRKRQMDVHFATFDPAAANLAMPASHCAPGPCMGPASMAPPMY